MVKDLFGFRCNLYYLCNNYLDSYPKFAAKIFKLQVKHMVNGFVISN